MDDCSCPICYEDFKHTRTITLKCDHKYHFSCIRNWAKTFGYIMDTTCPLCREKSVVYTHFEFTICGKTCGSYGFYSK